MVSAPSPYPVAVKLPSVAIAVPVDELDEADDELVEPVGAAGAVGDVDEDVGAAGVTELDAAEAGPVPTELVASTVKV